MNACSHQVRMNEKSDASGTCPYEGVFAAGRAQLALTAGGRFRRFAGWF